MKTTTWFIASIIPIGLLVFAMANRSDPSLADFYGFIGLPLAWTLTAVFIGRTVRAKDIPTSEKCAWIALLVLLATFPVALPVFVYARMVKPAITVKTPSSHARTY